MISMDTAERITKENIGKIAARMSARHEEMMRWSRENQNELGGVFGAIQKAMGEPEVPAGIPDRLDPLLAYDKLFFSELPTCEHNGRVFSVKARKERSLDAFIVHAKEKMEKGASIYLHNILWQPSYEVFGVRTEGFFMTRSAEFNWNKEEKQ